MLDFLKIELKYKVLNVGTFKPLPLYKAQFQKLLMVTKYKVICKYIYSDIKLALTRKKRISY